MKLIIVRHGITDENEKRIIQGHSMNSLSELGREQALKAAKRLQSENIDLIISSDLERCKQTAEIIARHNKVPVIYSKLLRERDYGELVGRTLDEIDEMCRQQGIPRYKLKVGCENYYDVLKRVEGFLQDIEKEHDGKTVVLVSHSGTIKCMLAALLKIPVEEIAATSYKNTAISIINIKEKKALLMNNIDHL